MRAGDFAGALTVAQAAVAQAEPLGYPPTLARAYLLEGEALERMGRAPEAEGRLLEAVQTGAQARDDRLIARAMVGLLWVVGYDQDRMQDAMKLRPLVEAGVVRAGGDDELRREYMGALGVILVMNSDFDGALQTFQRGVALAEKAHGPDDPRVALVLKSEGKVLHLLGRYEEALACQERAIAIEQAALGPGAPGAGQLGDEPRTGSVRARPLRAGARSPRARAGHLRAVAGARPQLRERAAPGSREHGAAPGPLPGGGALRVARAGAARGAAGAGAPRRGGGARPSRRDAGRARALRGSCGATRAGVAHRGHSFGVDDPPWGRR